NPIGTFVGRVVGWSATTLIGVLVSAPRPAEAGTKVGTAVGRALVSVPAGVEGDWGSADSRGIGSALGTVAADAAVAHAA
ncbi:MAG: hypothetical protein ACRDDJ_10305, partial [[Mycobacterium] stephanolepidis]